MSFVDDAMSAAGSDTSSTSGKTESRGLWSPEEHELFVEGIKLFPSGPWKDIASHVGSRTARQTMTHAQKYRQKIARRLRNVRMSGRHNLPFILDRSSRFNALLSNEEQFNDSILATSLAIAAEQELDMLGEDDGSFAMAAGGIAMDDMAPMPMAYQKLPPAIDFNDPHANAQFLDGPSYEPSDIEFDKCMDFLIETFHRES